MLSIFLVDDEPLIRRGLKKLIPWEQYGFKISEEANNGEEALKLITSDNADIVITDLKMPVMDGLELSNNLKNCFPGIRVIVLTGFDDFALVQQSIRNGVVDYLLKPVNVDLLVESLLKIKKQIEEAKYSYPFLLESQLISNIEAINMEEMLKTLQDLFDEFHKYIVPFEVVCRICRGLLMAVDRHIEQGGCNLKDMLGKDVLGNGYFCKYDSKEEVKSELVSIVSRIIEHRIGHSNKKIIQQIKDYIKMNLYEDISLNLLAAKFFLNPSYLSQLFKNETNENYMDYMVKLRIDKAKKLLGDQNLKIQDISEIVGYSDSKYFGRLFKKHVGVLPSEYRLKLMNGE